MPVRTARPSSVVAQRAAEQVLREAARRAEAVMADGRRRAAAVVDDARERARALIDEAQGVVGAAAEASISATTQTPHDERVNRG